MANIHIGDDMLNNILARLPGKSLLRFRCVSKHWNYLISDPYFMKSRSRRMILLPYTRPLVAIDDNVPVEDKAHSMVTIRSPMQHDEGTRINIIGTFNGVVLLALSDISFGYKMILYNPLTCASKELVVMDPSSNPYLPYVFGFGYGATPNDLKIVRIEYVFNDDRNHEKFFKCDAFDLITSSWSTSPQYLKRYFDFGGDPGMFLDGFLYWSVTIRHFGILALNVKEMVFSKVMLPKGIIAALTLLGSVKGHLCMITYDWPTDLRTFKLWLKKDQSVFKNKWIKVCSLNCFSVDRRLSYPMCILGDGRILICSNQVLAIYDRTKDSYKVLDGLPTYEIRGWHSCLKDVRSIEYVESLISPSDLC